MYAFLDRLVRLTLPRIGDFQGLDKFQHARQLSFELKKQAFKPIL